METKTAYVASRTSKREEVERIYSKLEEIGYSISCDWTKHKNIKPYSENPKLAEEYSAKDIEGIRKSNLFIILEDDAGTGIHSELGAAIDHFVEFKKPLIYAIGKSFNGSIFYFHPSVKRKETIEEMIKELKEIKSQ